MGAFSWTQRIQRAEILLERYEYARDVLNFTREVLQFQKDVYDFVDQRLGPEVFASPTSVRQLLSERWGIFVYDDTERPLRSDFLDTHLPMLFPHFFEFLDRIRRVGPPTLAAVVDQLRNELTAEAVGRVLQAYWRHEALPTELAETEEDASQLQTVLAFLAKLFLQPYAECLADRYPDKAWLDEVVAEGSQGGLCPLCRSRPQLSVLRPEAQGTKRSLMCSLCGVEWRFKRICCPACGEERFWNLAYYKTEAFPHVRVEACLRCRRYLKGVDLSVDGHAVPLVDEVAALPLDLWAGEQGFQKIELNVVGG